MFCQVKAALRLHKVLWAAKLESSAQEDIVTTGNQYILLAYHYNKEVQELKYSIVHYLNSKRNISDLMTKAVDHQTMVRLVEALSGYDTRLLMDIIKELQAKELYYK